MGLIRIYKEFSNDLVYRGPGSEGIYISNLMTLYQEWAFHLHPGIAFNDMVFLPPIVSNL